MTWSLIFSAARQRLASLLVILAGSMVVSSCTTVTYLADASLRPPHVEVIRSKSGQPIELYSLDIGDGPKRALFFVSGSGCASLSYFMRSYFTGLTGSWKIYAVQKEGVSRSNAGLFCDQRFADSYYFPAMKERNRVALEEVVRRHGQVNVLGVSEGGQIAAELAQSQPAVRRLAVIGSGGLPFRSVGRLLDARQGGTTFERAFAQVDADPNSTTQKALGYTNLYWSSAIDIDPAPVYLSLRIPILMIFGERDESVPVEAARTLEQRFASARGAKFRLIVVPGANHVLKEDGVDHKPEIMGVISTFFGGA